MQKIQDSFPQKYSLFLHSILYSGYEAIQYYPLFQQDGKEGDNQPTIIYHMDCLPNCKISQKILECFSEKTKSLEIRCQFCSRKIRVEEIYRDSSMRAYREPVRIDFVAMKMGRIQYPMSQSPLQLQIQAEISQYNNIIHQILMPSLDKTLKLPKLPISHLKYTKWLSKMKKSPICSDSKTEQIQAIKNYYHYGLMPSFTQSASVQIVIQNEEYEGAMVDKRFYKQKMYFGRKQLELEEQCVSIGRIGVIGSRCVLGLFIGSQICVLLKIGGELAINEEKMEMLKLEIVYGAFIIVVWGQKIDQTHNISLNIYEVPPLLNLKSPTSYCIQPLHSVLIAKFKQQQKFALNLSKTHHHLLLSLSTPYTHQIYSISNLLNQQIKISQILTLRAKSQHFPFSTIQKINLFQNFITWIQFQEELGEQGRCYRIRKMRIDMKERKIGGQEVQCQTILKQMQDVLGERMKLDRVIHEDQIKQQIFVQGYMQADLKSINKRKQDNFTRKQFILKLDIKHPQNSAYFILPPLNHTHSLQLVYIYPHISNWLISTHKIQDGKVSLLEICIL